jgi:hypothetical protein
MKLKFSKAVISDKTLRSMTPKATETATRGDSDARPLSAADLKRM